MQENHIQIKLFVERWARHTEEFDRHTEAAKTELDQHAVRLGADLSSECYFQAQAAKDSIDEHTGCNNATLRLILLDSIECLSLLQ